MYHTPMCKMCNQYEAGTFYGGDVDFCSDTCGDRAHGYMIDAMYEDMATEYAALRDDRLTEDDPANDWDEDHLYD